MKEDWFEDKMNDRIQNMDHKLDLDLAWDRLESARTKKKKRPLLWIFFGLGCAIMLVATALFFSNGLGVSNKTQSEARTDKESTEETIARTETTIEKELKSNAGASIDSAVSEGITLESNSKSISNAEVVSSSTPVKNEYLKSVDVKTRPSSQNIIDTNSTKEQSSVAINDETTTIQGPLISRNVAVGTEIPIEDDSKETTELNAKETSEVEEANQEEIAESVIPDAPITPIVKPNVGDEEEQPINNQENTIANEEKKSKDEENRMNSTLEANDQILINKKRNWGLVAHYQLSKGNRIANANRHGVEARAVNEEFLESHNVSLQVRRYIDRFFMQAGLQFGQYTSRMREEKTEGTPVLIDGVIVEINRIEGEPEFISGTANGTAFNTLIKTRYLKYRTAGLNLGLGYKIPISDKMQVELSSDLLFDVWQMNQGKILLSEQLEEQDFIELSELSYDRKLIVENISRIGLTRQFTEALNVGVNLSGKFDLSNRLVGEVNEERAVDKFYGAGVGVNLEYRF